MRLPVSIFVRRSLLLGSRKIMTYILRAGVLVFLSFVLLSVQMTADYIGAPGLMLFQFVVYINAVLIFLSGPFYFASIITEEKEDMTLGYLKMAGLSPFSIVAGKGTAQLLGAAMLLVCQLPFVVLSVTLGGVSLGQVLAAYVALFAHLVLVANVALLFSVVFRRGSHATFVTLLVLFGFFAGVPFVAAVSPTPTTAITYCMKTVTDALVPASVFVRLEEILRTGFAGPWIEVQLVGNVLCGAAFFAVSVLTFDFFTREEHPVAPPRTPTTDRSLPLRWLRPSPMWRNALAWKDFNFMAGGRASLIVKFVAYGVLIGFIAFLSHTFDNADWREGFSTTAMVISAIFAAVEIVHQAGRIFAAERQWGTLSALMVLPMSTARIAYSKALGCALGLVPAAVWFLVGMLLVPEPLNVTSADLARILFGVAAVLVEVLLVAHLVAWFSILVRHGGTLLALGVYFVGNMFFGFWVIPLVLFVPQGWYFGVWALAGRIAIVAFLHYLVLSRLRTVAAR